MTNILQLPTSLSGTLPVVQNADWRTTIQFNWPAGSANAGQPLDITGISFRIQVRKSVSDSTILLDLSTETNLLIIDGPLGQLSFAVPRDKPANASGQAWYMSAMPLGQNPVCDIVASGDGMIINLCQEGAPISVPVSAGVTRSQPTPV